MLEFAAPESTRLNFCDLCRCRMWANRSTLITCDIPVALCLVRNTIAACQQVCFQTAAALFLVHTVSSDASGLDELRLAGCRPVEMERRYVAGLVC